MKTGESVELMQLFGHSDILSFLRMSWLNWIGHVNSTRKVSQVFNSNPEGSRLTGWPKNRLWNCVQTEINKCKIKNWIDRSKNRADLETSIREARVRIGLQGHLDGGGGRRRGRRRTGRRRRRRRRRRGRRRGGRRRRRRGRRQRKRTLKYC